MGRTSPGHGTAQNGRILLRHTLTVSERLVAIQNSLCPDLSTKRADQALWTTAASSVAACDQLSPTGAELPPLKTLFTSNRSRADAA